MLEIVRRQHSNYQVKGKSRTCGCTAYTFGIDLGWTFTDFLLSDHAAAGRIFKVLSTPDDPSNTVMVGLTDMDAVEGLLLNAFLADVQRIVHGTTGDPIQHMFEMADPLGLRRVAVCQRADLDVQRTDGRRLVGRQGSEVDPEPFPVGLRYQMAREGSMSRGAPRPDGRAVFR